MIQEPQHTQAAGERRLQFRRRGLGIVFVGRPARRERIVERGEPPCELVL